MKRQNKTPKDKMNEYIKKNFWKRFFQYKVLEIILIPFCILILWKLPIYIAWGLVKLFHINPLTNTWFCKDINAGIMSTPVICDGVNISTSSFWFTGILILFVIGIIIFVNYKIVEVRLEKEAEEKYCKVSTRY